VCTFSVLRTWVAIFLGLAALTGAGADLPPLNTPATSEHYTGKFIWGDLFTADPGTAETFYTGLFGWKSATLERTTPSGTHHYIVLSVGDRPIAGIVNRSVLTTDEVHGRWVGYVSVPDVAQAVVAATAGGGRVVAPARVLAQRGAQALLADPEGATLGVMHSSSGDPGEYLPEPGDWTWAELFARDPREAGAFYHAVVGYDAIADVRAASPSRLLLVSGGYSRASVAPVPSRPKAHPAWLLFVRVASVKATVARAVQLGGRVLVPPSDKPAEYWRAVIADPTGAHIGVVELEESPAPGGKR
jgi:predicted enzyme related to lactoylglutathione lyase